MQTTTIRTVWALLLALLLQSFNYNNSMQHNDDPVTDVKKALDGQVAAWNTGDLEKAMTFYWNSPDMLWISRAGIQKGYQDVLEGFRKDFADKSKMGVYSYDSLHIEKISAISVYFVIRWKIVLNGQKIMGGISSQLWKKIDNNWVITAEHAS